MLAVYRHLRILPATQTYTSKVPPRKLLCISLSISKLLNWIIWVGRYITACWSSQQKNVQREKKIFGKYFFTIIKQTWKLYQLWGYTSCSCSLIFHGYFIFHVYQNVSVHTSGTSISASVRVPWRGQQLCVPPDQLADICLVLGETWSSHWLGPMEGGGNTVKLLLKPTHNPAFQNK